MTRFCIIAFLSMLTAFLFSCSGTQTVQQSDSQSVSQTPYPSWYQPQAVVDNDSLLAGYAAAIDSDSAASVHKAIGWAETELSSSVAASLEEIRTDLQPSQEALNSPGFIHALARNEAVEKVAQTVQTEVESVEGYSSHRSYAEVHVAKEELVEALEQELGQYEKAWKAMTASQAFKEYSR